MKKIGRRTILGILVSFLFINSAHAEIDVYPYNPLDVLDVDTEIIPNEITQDDLDTLDAKVGITGYTIEDFEDVDLISGLTIEENNKPETNILDVVQFATTPQNWDGVYVFAPHLIESPDIVFRYAPGAKSFGIGVGDVSTETDLELFVNGVNQGYVREFSEYYPPREITQLQHRGIYFRIDASGCDAINTVRFSGNVNWDGLSFDRLAIENSREEINFSIESYDPTVVFTGTTQEELDTLDAKVGITGYTIEDFEDIYLIPGLTIEENNNPETNILKVVQEANTPQEWDGNFVFAPHLIDSPDIIFRYAPGAKSFGIGVGDVSSDTNLELFVNGVSLGLVRNLNYNPLEPPHVQRRGVYLRIDASDFGKIYTVMFSGNVNWDGLSFDRLAVKDYHNAPPTAHPGPNIRVHPGDLVCLDGSQSDDDNTAQADLDYLWSVMAPSENYVTLDDPKAIVTCFVAEEYGEYFATLIVTDICGLDSEPSSALISSENMAPVANAGLDGSGNVGQEIVLDGSGSYDPDGDLLFYSWYFIERPDGSNSELACDDTETPSFIPDLPGTYTIELVVTDGIEYSDPNTVTFVVFTPGDCAQENIKLAIEIIENLDRSQVTSPGNQNAMIRLLNNANRFIQECYFKEAIKKIKDVIERTDGCCLRGEPDIKGEGKDWIIDCEAQVKIYNHLKDALACLDIKIDSCNHP